ncbi:MAG: PEP-CTERM sorting domain-containing protein [Bryobacterales bacterium]|nr:PEP-CTERM sorting domain-containing protein [Bryobacterales bacterium]
MNTARLVLPLALLLLSALQAPAAIITYTDRTAFLANLTSLFENDFESLALGSITSPQSFSANGFSYQVSSDSVLYVVDTSGDQSLAENTLPNGLGFLNLSANIWGLGGYFFYNLGTSIANGGGTLTATNAANETANLSVTNPANTTTFFGFLSTSGPLTSVTFTEAFSNRGFLNVDDLIVGNNVPEPATFALTAAALAAAGLLRRRRA